MLLEKRGETALSRTALSRPVALALDEGLLSPGATFFDYGCGRGGDQARLSALGFEASGWDPAHFKQGALHEADVVNIGYVVNVIENPVERVDALRCAWSLAKGLLVVAARTDWEQARVEGRTRGDGVVTNRGTFQKFYTQEELRDWIDAVLDVKSIAAAPGIFYVFRDPVRAQGYMAARVRRRVSRAPRVPRQRMSGELYEANKSLLEPLVAFIEERGRVPELDELVQAPAIIERFGSVRAALTLIKKVTGDESWEAARTAAIDDLLVYLALAGFGGRPKLSGLPIDTQYDVRAFFGNYKYAVAAAEDLLFKAGDMAVVAEACRKALVGKLTREALYVHRTALERLSPVLRVYEGCARTLTGTVDGTTLMKLNYLEPKVSYLVYPEFDDDPHPALAVSVRADLQRLRVKVREFRRHTNPPILHRKEMFVAEGYPGRDKFARLTAQEERHGLYEDITIIGMRNGWNDVVAQKGFRFKGHRLVRQ